MSHIFKILFQSGDINIFVLLGTFCSIYVQLKISDEILTKKNSGEI